MQIYIDGVLNASGTLDTGTKAAQFYLIGALTDRNNAGYVTGANYFNGQLDEVRIYNHVLSAAEIAALGQIPSPPSGLSVSTVADSGSILQLSWTNTAVATQDIAIERKIGASGTYEQIATVAGTENSYFDTNLDAGTQYSYRVQAVGAAGPSDYSNESSAIPPVPEIVGHFIFYNTSSFDGQNGSSNVADGFALATDKQVLLPGETATFANYSSYSKGINGIMIDVKNFEGSITPDDYEIRVGNTSDPTQWDLAPDPTFVTEYPGFGVGGSIRLELVWDNNTIQNEWVQVTLKADAEHSAACRRRLLLRQFHWRHRQFDNGSRRRRHRRGCCSQQLHGLSGDHQSVRFQSRQSRRRDGRGNRRSQRGYAAAHPVYRTGRNPRRLASGRRLWH